jgi:hypothetical protein
MKRLIVMSAAVVALAGLAVVAPSVVTPDQAPQAQAHQQYTDGCTVVPDSGWGFDFHAICDLHDLDYVYRPHGVNEWGRSVADLTFLYRMRDHCRARPAGAAQTNCYSVAQQYYNGVRTFGLFFYYDWSPWRRAQVRMGGW